ncbi:hypothetical protein RchiOBHm_Chr6g0253331 [Rosa chinensis]|uniref:Uncharacterized protein n=1 Tax=Rosa chinensis TaxID=74649 RepID=A0A2P6PLD1_ROSCH|nr:hypothetical protein RchiOBHm_Chr6g0253331 [Rosa chinensis]
MIKELVEQIKRLEACLATEESNRAKIDRAIDSIETQVTTARDGLVSYLAQFSSIEGSTQAANNNKSIWCSSCRKYLDAQVLQQLMAKVSFSLNFWFYASSTFQ